MAVHAERKLVDVTVTVSGVVPFDWRDMERAAKDLDLQVKQVNETLSDHASLKHIRLAVNGVMEDVCTGCGHSWETQSREGEIGIECAYCGVEVEQKEATDARQG